MEYAYSVKSVLVMEKIVFGYPFVMICAFFKSTVCLGVQLAPFYTP